MKSKLIICLLLIQSLYGIHDYQHWDGNQINNWWSNNGKITAQATLGGGMEWPAGSGDSPVFTAGLWVLAGQVNGSDDIRSAACEFTSEYVYGPWDSDPELPEYRIYKIRAADGRGNPDWDIWPVEQGAPWIDINEDGIYDPAIDSPDVKGDLYYWTVFNDGDASGHSNLWNTQPLGIEVTSAIYGFEGPDPLENVMFIEWNIQNVGGNQLDSVYLSIWQDIDLGSATNDFPGCLPDLDLSYHYVGELPDRDYGYHPPAVGFTFLQGPIVASVGDTAWVSGEMIPDFTNLHISAFHPYYSLQDYGDPETADEAYYNMQGRDGAGDLRINPVTGIPDPYIFSGNPLDGTGWLAANHTIPRDWRGTLSVGAFNLAPGETQQVVAACVVSPGMDAIAAVAALFDDVETVHDLYSNQFDNIDDLIQVSEIAVPHNTESSGPFEFQFEIIDAQNHWPSSNYLFYKLGGDWESTELLPQGDGIWQANLPDLLVSDVTTMQYHLAHMSEIEDQEYWPSGAPYNNRLFTFGPDLEPPVVAGLQEHFDVHFLLPFSKSVRIDTVYDLRAEIDEIWLNWTIGGSDIMTAPMVAIDTTEVDWQVNTVFEGVLSDMISEVGDTLKYWVTARDASINGNFGNSETQIFVGQNYESIGDWDHAPLYNEIVNWKLFELGQIFPFSNGSDHWEKTIQLTANSPEATHDTLEMVRELDLSRFDVGWIKTRMATNFADENTYGLVQIKTQGAYHTLDSLTGFTPPDTFSYDLAPFVGDTAVSLRFVAHSSQGFLYWIIDDVLFHTDPDLVGVKETDVMPLSFSLQQNYPNPFNPLTSIAFQLPQTSDVEFEIYDIRGRQIKSWSLTNQTVGKHKLFWDGTSDNGKLVATGVYLGHMKAGDHQATIKMVLLR
ncbi:MAG: T9SS type A sorting domain-containing protein [FCB group bacterium]|nr:T9SS type A sorting domain-containing protein [FCB group bacterium]MBL7123140.1 T9SS type A sorting domain-containing protein [Candidatus Neomarinimicrobiota bacterium]